MAAPLESSGQPPQGDQPTIWRAPSQETALTTRYNGRWATSSLVCVPAALRECRVPGLHAQTGNPPRATVPRNGGHQPKDWQALPFNEKRLNDLTKLLEADVSEVVCGVLFWFGCLVFFAPLFYAPGVFFFSFVSASSFDWHGADSALAVVHTLGLVGMSVSVCRDASLQFHAELWELMVMIGDPVVDACETGCAKRVLDHPCCQGDFSSLCNQTRTLCSTSRVAREIVLQPLQSDTD